MGIRDTTLEFLGFQPTKTTRGERAIQQGEMMVQEAQQFVRDGVSMMLQYNIALEDRNWISTSDFERNPDNSHITLKAIQNAMLGARALASGNPLIRSALLAKSAYILAEQVRITKAGKLTSDRRNKRYLFSLNALIDIVVAKATDGNILWFENNLSKQVTRIPFEQIKGAIYDSVDTNEIQYFLRVWDKKVTTFDTEGHPDTKTVRLKLLIPNRDWERGGVPLPDFVGPIPVAQDGFIYHFAANRSGGAWGVPDMLAGLFYTEEHKELIEAADAIYRAQSQYAIQYKTKSKAALQNVAAQMYGPAPRTDDGTPSPYGQSIAFGDDIEMQLMSKIGSGIDFANFDPIAALATSVLGIPIKTVLGEEAAAESLPPTMLRIMMMERSLVDGILVDIMEDLGKPNAKTYWPPIDADATHRQVQSIAGLAALMLASPPEIRALMRETFGQEWADAVPDPAEWEPFLKVKAAGVTPPAGSTETPPGGPVTPGQGQTGEIGKLADGDHSLRDAGEQDHTKK